MGSEVPPLWYRFDGRAMVPERPARAAHYFKVGETYRLVLHDERTSAEHGFYFAAVADAHRNLPEALADKFPTPDALRKHALIRTGFCNDPDVIIASDLRQAQAIAAALLRGDEYKIVTLDGLTITRLTAKSQSYRTMGKEEFRASKTAVLDFLVAMLGTSRNALENNTRSAA